MNDADIAGNLARGLDDTDPLVFARHLESDDVYYRGDPPNRVMLVIPGLWSSMSPELLTVMRARRACSVTGRCPVCDACADLATTTVRHEARCEVADDRLKAQVRRWSMKVGKFARGARIREDPITGGA